MIIPKSNTIALAYLIKQTLEETLTASDHLLQYSSTTHTRVSLTTLVIQPPLSSPYLEVIYQMP